MHKMDEPMEGCLDQDHHGSCKQIETSDNPSERATSLYHSGQSEKDSSSVSQGCYSPLLRPGSMVMMTLTEEDYEKQYWPKLKTAIDQLLNMKPMSYIPISYEQMYSCVYKCVCKQFSERLYNDLLQHLSVHMQSLNQELRNHEGDSVEFISSFSFLMHQYLHALSGIVPIFNYMNRFYVENKLQTDLNEELRKLFRVQVVDTHIGLLIKLLDEVSSVPFAVPPPTMASIVKNLFELNQNYSGLNPALFSRYLPNILPPSDPSLLQQYALEARTVQTHISSSIPDSNQNHNSNRKRQYEEEPSGN